MKRNLILLSSTILMVNAAAYAAPGKMVLPPPPKETLPGQKVDLIQPTPAAKKVETVAPTAEITVVGQGTCVAQNERVQRFVNYIELKPDMESAPLTLTITNGGFAWFRLLIANQVIATERSMTSGPSKTLDLTGRIGKGTNQIVIQAGGTAGARFDWKVTAPSIAKLEKATPDEVLVGDTVKITGKNFSRNTNANQIKFNAKRGLITKAQPTELEVRVPTDADLGDNKVTGKVNGIDTNSIKVKIRGIPEVTGANLQGCPPGQPLIIYGKNFSKNMSENKVFFGESTAEIVSGDTSQLTVVAPNFPYTAGHTPSAVKVQVGKIMSKNSISIQIGPQMYADPGFNPRDINAGPSAKPGAPFYDPASGNSGGQPIYTPNDARNSGSPIIYPANDYRQY